MPSFRFPPCYYGFVERLQCGAMLQPPEPATGGSHLRAPTIGSLHDTTAYRDHASRRASNHPTSDSLTTRLFGNFLADGAKAGFFAMN